MVVVVVVLGGEFYYVVTVIMGGSGREEGNWASSYLRMSGGRVTNTSYLMTSSGWNNI